MLLPGDSERATGSIKEDVLGGVLKEGRGMVELFLNWIPDKPLLSESNKDDSESVPPMQPGMETPDLSSNSLFC